MIASVNGYAAELQQIQGETEKIGADVLRPPVDVESAVRYVYKVYQRAALTGDLTALDAAEDAIDAVIPQMRYPDDLYLLKAHIALKLHRLEDVKRNLAARPLLAESDEGLKITADVHFQEGRYAEAKRTYEKAINANRSWDNLARYAYYVSTMEDLDRADAIYVEAQDEVTSKQMRSYAWLQLQRGLLDVARGRHEDARAHYRQAERAYPGYWMVDEHLAGLLACEGRRQEAAELYERVLGCVPKPEIAQILGDLYTALGQPDRAERHYSAAFDAYMQSVSRSEVHYYHHLVDYHCSVTRNGPEAVKWAQLDTDLRENFSTQAALARALHVAGQIPEAVSWMEQALASGAVGAGLFYQAAEVFGAAGRYEDSHRYAHRAADINPVRHPHGHHH
jgi:tetratricopeptide (TPR) repeat protein